MHCTFCKADVKEKGHTSKCVTCGAQAHNRGEYWECAGCGRRYPVEPVAPMSKRLSIEPVDPGEITPIKSGE